MNSVVTTAIEDYLKTIYELTTSQDRASTNQIAKALDIRPASVTGMIKKLSTCKPPMVDYRKHHGVALTCEGEKVALETIRHHRLLETFLYETLGFDWDTVHDEADRLEHVISEEFEDRMALVLGEPTHDPHGDPIPTRDLKMPNQTSTRLSDLQVGQHAIIQRVPDSNSELLRYLGKHGIGPGTCVEVTAYSALDENLTLLVQNHPGIVVLGIRITRQIFIEVLP
ncbi:MAG: metal-dependent transcriptional regulator [Anaerolineales bacterium]|jgi:DtxR family Mn-dependent transcriptional regulator